MKRKQFTIVAYGNRFGDYLSKTMQGYYTRWTIKYNYNQEYKHYKLKDVKVKNISLSPSEITERDIKRTIDYYNKIHLAGNDLPYWLEVLIKKKDLDIKELIK